MAKLIQLLIGWAAVRSAAGFLYDTPFDDVVIYVPLFVGAMYLTALIQFELSVAARCGTRTPRGAKDDAEGVNR